MYYKSIENVFSAPTFYAVRVCRNFCISFLYSLFTFSFPLILPVSIALCSVTFILCFVLFFNCK